MTKSGPVQTLLGCYYFSLKVEAAYPIEVLHGAVTLKLIWKCLFNDTVCSSDWLLHSEVWTDVVVALFVGSIPKQLRKDTN